MPSKNKRLRVIAGPNGSGKSTVINRIKDNFYCGPFVNADLIERSFLEKGLLNLSDFSLDLTKKSFDNFIKKEGVSWIRKANDTNTTLSLTFSNNNLVVGDKPNAYDAAIAADYVRHQLLETDNTFTFETVLSHSSKIKFIEVARDKGYKIYLYFICTVSPEINKARVRQRAALGGHDVPQDKILKRYFESLKLLPQLIPLSNRCFLFDNSALASHINLVAEIENGKKLTVHNQEVPWWTEKYVINNLFNSEEE